MLKTTKLAAFAILGAIAASAYAEDVTSKQAAAKPAAVTKVEIAQGREDALVANAVAQGQQDTPELRKAIRDRLVNNELIVQEALKKGLDKQPEFIEQLDMAKSELLANAFWQDYLKSHPVSDAEVQQEYDKVKESVGNKEFHPRHILVDTESEAKSIAAKLKKGAKFDAIAKKSSKDPSAKENGGDLGWIPVGKISSAYVKPFGDALLKLSKGQISEPVQSQFGWHVIQLEDVRDFKMPPVEQLKPRIVQALQQQALKNLVTELRAKAKVTE